MTQFNRTYRFSAGKSKRGAFEVGEPNAHGKSLHIAFSVEKADVEEPNTAKIELWNLSNAQIATLNGKDCGVMLRAGYGNSRPLVVAGAVTYASTVRDGADKKTEIEVVDGRVALRDGIISLSLKGKIGGKKLITMIAKKMGISVSFGHNATFSAFNGFSFVGKGGDALTRVTGACGMSWIIQNGVLQFVPRARA